MQERLLKASTSDGVEIAYVMTIPDGSGPQAWLVLLHGFPSGKNSKTNRKLLDALTGRNIATVRLDFRGQYDSSGSVEDVTITTGIEDLRAVMSALPQRSPDSKLILFATSYGGAVAIAGAAEYDPAALILKSPVVDIPEMQRRRRSIIEFMLWRLRGHRPFKTTDGPARLKFSYVSNAEKYDLYSIAERGKYSLTVMHGTEDDVVPFNQSVELIRRVGTRGQLVAFEGANHHYSNGNDFEAMITASVQAIDHCLLGKI